MKDRVSITWNQFMVLLDTLKGSLRLVDSYQLFGFTIDARQKVINELIEDGPEIEPQAKDKEQG